VRSGRMMTIAERI